MTTTSSTTVDAASTGPAPMWWSVLLRGGALGLATLSIFFALFAYGLSAVQEQRSQRQLYAQFRGLIDPSSAVAPPTGGVIAPGTPVALVNDPAAGWHDLMVVEGTSSSITALGPGHLPTSPLPGQLGDAVIVGRAATAGAPFAVLPRLRMHSHFTITTAQGVFHYRVLDRRVAGNPLPVLTANGSLVTFVTATGNGQWGRLVPSHLTYVDAVLTSTPVQAPSGRPTVLAASEIPGRGETGAWASLVLWLELAVLVGVAIEWLRTRWPWWRSWLLIAPVVLGVLWGVSVELLRLLPNVY
jgi:sortase A